MNEKTSSFHLNFVTRFRPIGLRILWLFLAALILGLFILSITPRLLQLTQLPYAERAILLLDFGISVQSYAVYIFVIEAIALLGFVIPAAVIYWHKPDDWVVFLVSVALMAFVAAVSPTFDILPTSHPQTAFVITLIDLLGVSLTLLVLYVFPDGEFVPPWTRILAYLGGGWLLLWLVFAPTADLSMATRILQIAVYTLSANPVQADRVIEAIRVSALMIVLLLWFASGLFAQFQRYRCVSTESQRQQTRWIVFGMALAFVGFFVYNLLLQIVPALKVPGHTHLLYTMIGELLYLASLMSVPILLTVSIVYYRLWNIDTIINRTLVYGLVTAILGIAYIVAILILQRLSSWLTGGITNEFLIVITTVVFTLFIMPLRVRVQRVVDRIFYREQIDFRQAFTEFSQQVRTIIDLTELLHVLVERTTNLYHARMGAVYLCQEGAIHLADGVNLPDETELALNFTMGEMNQLQDGNTLSRPNDPHFPLIVPLLAPKMPELDDDPTTEEGSPLQGVLVLGSRLSGLGYYRQDIALLRGLADQAGTAIYVARLIAEKEEETRLLAEAERHIEEHRQSPLGRAEQFTEQMLDNPDDRIFYLYQLAQAAGADIHAAELLHNLPQVLFNDGHEGYGRLAQGFEYIYLSRRQPEMLPVGLRTLITQLEKYQQDGDASSDNDSVLQLMRLALSAYESNSIAQITDWGDHLPDQATLDWLRKKAFHLQDIVEAVEGLRDVVNALKAYERLEAPEDRLAYLASAVERLGRLERMVRTRYGGADRPLLQGAVEKWLAVVTRAMGELQSRAHIYCELVTRHAWKDNEISVALYLRNDGRSAAHDIRISLAESPAYELSEASTQIDRLSPNEETQVTLRVRPNQDSELNQFRVRFTIVFNDPGAVDQVEHFADVVHLMQTTTEFRFIPNPYVVGTPLQSGSPMFFGREDVLAFVKENLAAAHRNNLVLIGQRRTGKTSLLKQLPMNLGDEYLPVFLDGQSLGLDPGLANFFLALSTEVAFALEDRGLEIDLPELKDFTESPAYSFEHVFLPKVSQVSRDRHIILMLDEFEEIESSVRRGDLDASIFGFMRHIIQHYENLSVIFCGTHRLEELASDYWNVLFNISLYRHITLLERDDAFRLIQEPVADFGMKFDDLALDKVWRITAGHPYFLQLICHSLVNRHNRTQRPYVTVADVNATLDDILASGEAHFMYLWNESSAAEKLTLTALSRMIPQAGYTSAVQVCDYLEANGILRERQEVSQALHHLGLRDVLTAARSDDQTSDEYAWKLGLLGMWVEKYKSLNRVVDEVTINRA